MRNTILLIITIVFSVSTAWGEIVKAIDTVGMTVSDMDRSVDFFSKVLSFQKISDAEVTGSEFDRLFGVFGVRMRVVRMKLGDESIELTEFIAPQGKPMPTDSRSNDLWFQHIAIVVRDMDQAYQHLRNYKVRHASAGPQRLPDSNKVVAGIRAFYFKDPDGHNLELIYFPPGKGEPRWQKPGDKLFLGIDHTAIVVSDTERGLKFYRDLLQFKVAGASENFGIEQERLNNVFGARLRITGLKAPAGPGIEFLEYLAPRDGRPAPLDLRANDIAHWHTTLFVPSADSAANKMLAGKARFVSPGIIETPDKASSFRKAFLVRDHDGHGLQLVEK